MNITVYLGASVGNDPAFLPAVQELGNWIGANGHALVYGGSKSGLMGALADSVLEAGGHVTGVEPSFFIEAEFQHDGIDDLIVTSDMAERKAKMIELGDAFIAFPGGTGTLEEIAEVMSAVSLLALLFMYMQMSWWGFCPSRNSSWATTLSARSSLISPVTKTMRSFKRRVNTS